MLVALFSFFLLLISQTLAAPPANSIPVRVVNTAGKPIELFWIDTFSPKNEKGEHKLVLQSQKPIRNNSDASINSYNTHQFLVRFAKHKENGPEVSFTKLPEEEVVTVVFDENSKKLSLIQKTKLDELMDSIKLSTVSCEEFDGDEYADCAAKMIMKDVNKIESSKNLIKTYKDMLAGRLKNYLCDDISVETSISLSNSTFTDSVGRHEVQTLVDSSHSQLYYVPNFLTEKECEVLTKSHNSQSSISTNSDFYTSKISPASNYILNDLQTRVVNFANSKKKMNLNPASQEDLITSLFLPGGEQNTVCDGNCDGNLVSSDGRVASALLYCEAPLSGGLTVFPNAAITVVPSPRALVLVSYTNSKGVSDEAYLARAECKVKTGKKQVTFVHLRNNDKNNKNSVASVSVDEEGEMEFDEL